MESSLTVYGEKICVFNTFDEWVDKASSRLSGLGKRVPWVCLDRQGFVCHIGEDFMMARDKGRFPVTAYVLTRSVEK